VLYKQNKETKQSAVRNNSLEWEKRSINYGSSLQSVLFKGMPDLANEHFHSIHVNFILDCINNQKDDLRILDVGCGYGRLSMPLVKKFPQAQISGMDISTNYVNLYKKNTGREALLGTLESLPPDLGTFDYIIVVTVLMYLPENKLEEIIYGLFSHLNQHGKIILIEPAKTGTIFQTGFGLSNLIQKDSSNKITNTGGICFSSSDIYNSVYKAGGIILREQRIPATTFFFPAIYLLTKILPNNWARKFLQGITAIDRLLTKTKLPTLWIFYLIEKK
jgi:2-polyprenyl-3-methyl-5-hydroxy-6-metoxy-1,4-benzoquinol methylase